MATTVVQKSFHSPSLYYLGVLGDLAVRLHFLCVLCAFLVKKAFVFSTFAADIEKTIKAVDNNRIKKF